jgi:ankyrin repeat protein
LTTSNLFFRCSVGSLPVTVLLWGFAAARRVNLMVSDASGNNPVHYAALAETPEVLGFLLQQSRGHLTPEIRLVDSRNAMGETPLLRAAGMGKIPVVKALLDEGSDPFATDARGQNAVIILARTGNLWCLHYYCIYLCERFGLKTAWQMLHSLDSEGHAVLDWAADNGSVNVLEYLIRKGLDPYRVDQSHRGPLYWTVKSRRLPAARFLVYCGCDPYYEDSTGQNCISLAEQLGDKEMVALLKTSVPGYIRTLLPSHNSNAASDAIDRFSVGMMGADNVGGQGSGSIHGGHAQANFITPIFSQHSNSSLNSPRSSKDRLMEPIDGIHVGDVEMAVMTRRMSEQLTPSTPMKLSSVAHMNSASSNNSSISTTSSSSSLRDPQPSTDNNTSMNSNNNTSMNSNNNTSYASTQPNIFVSAPSGAYSLDGAAIVTFQEPPTGWCSPSMHTRNHRRSKAIFRQNETKLGCLLFYTTVIVFYWFLTLCIPCYAYIILMGLTILGVRYLDNYAMIMKKMMKPDEKQKIWWIVSNSVFAAMVAYVNCGVVAGNVASTGAVCGCLCGILCRSGVLLPMLLACLGGYFYRQQCVSNSWSRL